VLEIAWFDEKPSIVKSARLLRLINGGGCNHSEAYSSTEYCTGCPTEFCHTAPNSQVCSQATLTSKNGCGNPNTNLSTDCSAETTGTDCGTRKIGEKKGKECNCTQTGNSCGGDKFKVSVESCDPPPQK
jgi:hypothetical protein